MGQPTARSAIISTSRPHNRIASVAWHYIQDPHHFVVLMGENVAMPDVPPRLIETYFDARDLFGQDADHVLRSVLDVFGRVRHCCTQCDIFQTVAAAIGPIVLQHRLFHQVGLKLLPAQHFEIKQVQVNRMSIAGSVVNLPDFRGAQTGILGGGRVPGNRTVNLITRGINDGLGGPQQWLKPAIYVCFENTCMSLERNDRKFSLSTGEQKAHDQLSPQTRLLCASLEDSVLLCRHSRRYWKARTYRPRCRYFRQAASLRLKQ